MKKFASSLAVILAMLSANTVNAATTSWVKVTSISQYRSTSQSGKTLISLTGTACSNGDYYIPGDSVNKEMQMQILLAALLSKSDVQLYWNSASDGCEVAKVTIRAED